MDVLKKLLASETPVRVTFWSSLIHNLTVRARGAYPELDSSFDVSNFKDLRGINELIHQVSGYLTEPVTEGREGDEHFFGRLVEHAAHQSVEDHFVKAVESSLRGMQSWIS